ncbi:hypothetical protein RDV89_07350 [Nocardioides zeae]|uniref:Integral membrane protein n=1 Tax=Nocardioides imazamoxiresistens TaxID=3231893 RepID=A0ABU3PUH4_9ACTN|nr:hypothetical protein [Nocardioides zeae]MDT9592878.1 hypothetical protein [Nocardioides zeae]
MWDPLQIAIVASSLAVAAWCGWYVARDLRPDPRLGLPLWIVELLLVAQLVVGVVQAFGDVPAGVSLVTFVGYLVGLVVMVPIGIWWAAGEPSRAGTGVLLVVLLVIPVLVVRLEQIWNPASA